MPINRLKKYIYDARDAAQKNIFSDDFDMYQKQKQYVDTFKKELKNAGKKIIVIDELDRCNPIFSVKILERVKHLFDTENTIFIFGLNILALSNSIKKIYGNDIDGGHYLQRFFDYHYVYQPNKSDLLSRYNQEFQYNIHIGFLRQVNEYFDFSTREIIKVLRIIGVAQNHLNRFATMMPNDELSFELQILYFFAFLKIKNIQAYQNIDDLDFISSQLEQQFISAKEYESDRLIGGVGALKSLNLICKILKIDYKKIKGYNATNIVLCCLVYIYFSSYFDHNMYNTATVKDDIVNIISRDLSFSGNENDVTSQLRRLNIETLKQIKNAINASAMCNVKHNGNKPPSVTRIPTQYCYV